jgi:trimeric autotransporter adhesin
VRLPILCGLLAVGLSACGSGSTAPPGSVAKIVVSPDSTSLPGGETVVLSAQAQSSSGHTLSGVTIFWSTNDTAIATVSQAGVVTAHANGSARIAASADNQSGYATVVVQPLTVASVTLVPTLDTIYATAPRNSATITATTRDAAGAVLTGQPLIWSATGGVVDVTNSGLVTATNTAAGRATVTATSSAPGLPSGSATIVVIGHAAKVTVSPASSSLSVGGVLLPATVQLSATITDTFGSTVAGRTVHWTSSDPSVATVNSTGLVTAVAASATSVTITAATTDGVTGTASVGVPF